MKNTFKISVSTILLSALVASCATSQVKDAANTRIIEKNEKDTLVEVMETPKISDSVPSVGDKIIITKETIAAAETNPVEDIQIIKLSEGTSTITPKEPVLTTTPEIIETSKKEEAKSTEIDVSSKEVSVPTSVPAIPVEDDVVTTSANNAAVGECYGKVRIAGRFKDVEEDVMVQPETMSTNIIPAKYATKDEEIIVREATFKYVEIPATYKTVTEEVTIEPEKKEMVTIPAQYKTVVEKVMVQPARKVWKKGRGLIEKVGSEGDILCLVEEPAVYKDVEKQVVTVPERTETRVIPAVKKVISKQVIDQPVRIEKIAVPAVKQTIQQRVQVEPEKTVVNKKAAVYQKVRKRIQVSEDRMELLPVICDSNINRDLIVKIQTALVDKGYDIGEIDGFFGEKTSNAINQFQRSLGLESGGITYETARALNITI